MFLCHVIYYDFLGIEKPTSDHYFHLRIHYRKIEKFKNIITTFEGVTLKEQLTISKILTNPKQNQSYLLFMMKNP